MKISSFDFPASPVTSESSSIVKLYIDSITSGVQQRENWIHCFIEEAVNCFKTNKGNSRIVRWWRAWQASFPHPWFSAFRRHRANEYRLSNWSCRFWLPTTARSKIAEICPSNGARAAAKFPTLNSGQLSHGCRSACIFPRRCFFNFMVTWTAAELAAPRRPSGFPQNSCRLCFFLALSLFHTTFLSRSSLATSLSTTAKS